MQGNVLLSISKWTKKISLMEDFISAWRKILSALQSWSRIFILLARRDKTVIHHHKEFVQERVSTLMD